MSGYTKHMYEKDLMETRKQLSKYVDLNEKLNSGFGPTGVRTKSWTKLIFLNYVYTEMDSFHPTIF